jgi:hypothetical protein
MGISPGGTIVAWEAAEKGGEQAQPLAAWQHAWRIDRWVDLHEHLALLACLFARACAADLLHRKTAILRAGLLAG